jgi:two-component system, OmpR family, KDP operon response regulator KdpE
MNARVLVIDDEGPIRRFLHVGLEAEGHSVIEPATAREAVAATVRENPALLVLDHGLPDADGLTVLREVRGWSQVPVLILSVRSNEAEKVEALDGGAQDYVVKPFGMKEFLARVRTLLRDRSSDDMAQSSLSIGPLAIDASTHTAMLEGRALHLTRREFDLLWMMASHRGRLVTQEMILKAIWGPAHVHDSQYLRVHIRQLRQKLGDDRSNPRFLFTEPGIGYRMAEE